MPASIVDRAARNAQESRAAATVQLEPQFTVHDLRRGGHQSAF